MALPKPTSATGPNGEHLHVWNIDRHHWEIEVKLDGTCEFFYLNLETDEMWNSEWKVWEMIPRDVAESFSKHDRVAQWTERAERCVASGFDSRPGQ